MYIENEKSVKDKIHNFGIVLFELATGKKIKNLTVE